MNYLHEVKKNPAGYVWGPVVKIHEIGEYAFVEFQETDINNNSKLTGKHSFSVFINGESTNYSASSLDDAMVTAIAIKHDGHNTRAHLYFSRMVGMKE